MKLRIRGDSLRLRLTRGEAERLADGGEVREAIHFAPDRRLIYSIRTAEVDRVQVTFDGAHIEVLTPRSMARTWAMTDQVAIESEQGLDDGRVLILLVEKDFRCLAPRVNEPDDDNFPNPRADC